MPARKRAARRKLRMEKCEPRRLFAADSFAEDVPVLSAQSVAEDTSIPVAESVSNAFDHDVNGDTQITALDALLVINQLHRQQIAEGEGLEMEREGYDVNQDGQVSALDALLIVNQLHQASLQSSNALFIVSVPGIELPHLPSGCTCGNHGCPACAVQPGEQYRLDAFANLEDVVNE